MPKSPKARSSTPGGRMVRVGDLMHRTIAKALNEEFKDPRIGMVTVTSVEVSRDLSYAKVFVTVFEEDKVEETLKILNQAAGFFRAHLAKSMHLRVVPRPHFIFDESVMRGARMTSLLSNVIARSDSSEAIQKKEEPNDNA